MHKTRWTAIAAAFLAAAGALPVARAAPSACEGRAMAMLDALEKHDYEAARRDWDRHMRTTSTPAQFQAMWEALVGSQYTPYRSHGTSATATANGDGTVTVAVPLDFEYVPMTAYVTCDPKEGGAIAEFVVR